MNDLLRGIAIVLVAIVGLRNSLWIGRVERQLKDRLDENEKRIDQLSNQVIANGRSVAWMREDMVKVMRFITEDDENGTTVTVKDNGTFSASESEEER